MTTESLSRELDAHIVTLLTRISALKENNGELTERKAPMSIEARSLELWRAVAVECFATFLFSLVVSGAAASSVVSGSGLCVLATAVASGFAIAAISLIFGHISGKDSLINQFERTPQLDFILSGIEFDFFQRFSNISNRKIKNDWQSIRNTSMIFRTIVRDLFPRRL